MAVIHRATLVPSKQEALAGFVPGRTWAAGVDVSTLEIAGTYRFDDPDGEVGIETFLVRAADESVLQVPATFRGSPLPGADAALICTMEHSVLGTRWMYDGVADPVYLRAALHAILDGGREADVEFADGSTRENTTHVTGSGTGNVAVPEIGTVTVRDVDRQTLVGTAGLTLVVHRVVATGGTYENALHLTGTWPGQDDPTLLASVR